MANGSHRQQPIPRIAVLVPCLNEEGTIAKVVADFGSALPGARIVVYDNNSSDRTVQAALEAGAEVRREARPGKGNVVRRMFAEVDADVYVVVDGDDTYEAAAAPRLVERLLCDRLDMVNGARIEAGRDAFRTGHRFGNRALNWVVGLLFEQRFRDMLSGYRVLSRRFVKSFPVSSAGFEIETEMIVHALEMRMPVAEVDTGYRERPSGSHSKLNTVLDGWRILFMILNLLRQERPLRLAFAFCCVFALVALGLGVPVVIEFFKTGLVPRLPTAVLAMGLMIMAFLFLIVGIVLDSVVAGHRELKRLAYLSFPAPGGEGIPAKDSGAGGRGEPPR